MSARLALGLGLALGLTACATSAPLSDGPQIVQLSLSATPEPCDWSGQYEPLDVPDQWAIGATYWPHTMPRPSTRDPNATAPLAFYGSVTQFTASETSPIVCLRLYKRPSLSHTGIAPVAVIAIVPEGDTAHVSALRIDRKISHLDLGLASLGTAPTIEVSMVGGRFVERPSPARQVGATDQPTPVEATTQTLSLDMSKGRAEARIKSLPYNQLTRVALAAHQARSPVEARDTLNTLIGSRLNGATEARFENQDLGIHPR